MLHRPRLRPWTVASLGLLLSGCTIAHRSQAPGSLLCPIGITSVAPRTDILGTPLGGISGIDYDPQRQQYLLISDDRSAHGPARIYTARLHYTPEHLSPPEWTAVVFLRDAEGRLLPSQRQHSYAVDVPDAEAVRWVPGTPRFLWTSEGDFTRGWGPQLRESRLEDGATLRSFALPATFTPDPLLRQGPRSNGTLEGLALTPDARTVWVAMELPWWQDGAAATPNAPGAPVRITALDLDSGAARRQIAYQPEAVPWPRRVPLGPQMNGVSEVLADGPHHLLVMERAYSTGRGFSVRLFRIDTRQGSDTLDLTALTPTNHQPVPKTLVADLDGLGLVTDNLEGMTWGAPLPDGTRVLVLVSDDNFNPAQATQFIALAERPCPVTGRDP